MIAAEIVKIDQKKCVICAGDYVKFGFVAGFFQSVINRNSMFLSFYNVILFSVDNEEFCVAFFDSFQVRHFFGNFVNA